MNLSALIALARKIGPQMVKFVIKWAPILLDKNNQRLTKQAQDLISRLAKAQKARSKKERLRLTLGVVKEQAQKLQSSAEDEAAQEQAALWVRQADSLLGALSLLNVRTGRQHRAGVKRISQEADALFAAVMEATMTARPISEDSKV